MYYVFQYYVLCVSLYYSMCFSLLYYVFQCSLVNEFGSVAPAEICTHSLIFRYAFSKLLRSK